MKKKIFLIIVFLFSKNILKALQITNHNALTGHKRKINALAISNKLIATGSWDNTIKLWDNKGNEIKHLSFDEKKGHVHFITDLNFDKSSARLICGSSDHTATIWNINNFNHIKLLGHNDFITNTEFSKNDTFIATSSYDYSVKIWDNYGNLLKTLIHPNPVIFMKISSDSKLIVTACRNIGYIWDINSGNLLHQLITAADITALELSINDEYIATGHKEGSVILWNTSGTPLMSLKEQNNAISSLSISPNNNLIASGSYDLTTCVWNIKTGLLKYKINDIFWVLSTAISNDNKFLVTGSKVVNLYNLENGQLICQCKEIDNLVTKVDFIDSNKLIFVSNELAKIISYKKYENE